MVHEQFSLGLTMTALFWTNCRNSSS